MHGPATRIVCCEKLFFVVQWSEQEAFGAMLKFMVGA